MELVVDVLVVFVESGEVDDVEELGFEGGVVGEVGVIGEDFLIVYV